MAPIAPKMDENGLEWLKMAQTLPKTTKSSPIWLKITEMTKRAPKIDHKGPKQPTTTKMAQNHQNGLSGPNLAQNH